MRSLSRSEIIKAQQEQRAFEAWLDRVEPSVARKIARSKNRLIRRVSDAYAASPDSNFTLFERDHMREIEAILREVYAKVIPRRAADTLDAIRSLKRWPNYAGYFDRLIQMWASKYVAEKVIGISDTTMSDIKRIVNRAVDSGMSNAATAKEIRKVTAFSAFRAAAVARTEIHGAALFAQSEIAKQAQADFGIKLMKFWIPTIDARTRDAHAAMASASGVEVGGKFNVGGRMMDRPGDPSGGAGNVINCRCGLVHRELEYTIE